MFQLLVPSLSQWLLAFGSLVALDLLDLPPSQAPFLSFIFPLSKDPKGGPRAQWLCSQVASQKTCCSIERHVESWGEKEEHVINHGLLKARREKQEQGRVKRTEPKWRIFYPPVLVVALVDWVFLDICPDTCWAIEAAGHILKEWIGKRERSASREEWKRTKEWFQNPNKRGPCSPALLALL